MIRGERKSINLSQWPSNYVNGCGDARLSLPFYDLAPQWWSCIAARNEETDRKLTMERLHFSSSVWLLPEANVIIVILIFSVFLLVVVVGVSSSATAEAVSARWSRNEATDSRRSCPNPYSVLSRAVMVVIPETSFDLWTWMTSLWITLFRKEEKQIQLEGPKQRRLPRDCLWKWWYPSSSLDHAVCRSLASLSSCLLPSSPSSLSKNVPPSNVP